MPLLHEHTTTTAADALERTEVAVLPTGSTEQHGPHLPLGTDFLAAEAMARTVADREECVVLPTLPVGVSEHHRQFHGTLWTDPETFEDHVADVLAGVATHGVRKAVVVNGHGGNTGAIRRAARRLRREDVAFVAPWNWWDSVGELADDLFDGALGHADAMETSVILAIAPELVREEGLEAAEDGASDGWGESVHGAEVGFDTADFSDSGAVGRPTEGSAEAGERLVDAAADELDALVDWLADRPFEELRPAEHR